MAGFRAKDKTPGVYIQEINVPGPIPGAGTSTAAFLGPAQKGPLLKPAFLTNPGQFQNAFGSYIEDPLRVYVTHAVNGFFAEGGSTCYFVRVGTGQAASWTLFDRSGKGRPTLVVAALQEGAAGNSIKVKVTDASIATTTAVKTTAPVALDTAKSNQPTAKTKNAGDAANFQPGDLVFLQKDGNSERAIISGISKDQNANTTTFTFLAGLSNDYSGGTLRIADLIPGQTRIRVVSTTGIEPGSYITISQETTTENQVVRLVDRTNNFITLAGPLVNTYAMTAGAKDVTLSTLEFSLTISAPGKPDETFPNLSIDPRHSRYFASQVASASVSVSLADPPTPTSPTDNLPVKVDTAVSREKGADDNIKSLQPSDYHKAIDTLQKASDVNILCVPDAVADAMLPPATQDIQSYMIAHCGKMQDRFAILDPRKGAHPSNGIVDQRNNLSSDNGYAALYYPWISISNPVGPGRVLVPPSGHIAGVFANNDNKRGVHKAPANESITSALALEETITDDENGPLNEQGINVIRAFPGRGIKVWGARTIAPHDITQWRYVNVRRLLLFIEKSIQEGTRFAVFEPNNLSLWQTVKRLITGFLTDVWRDGALFGATADQAFQVRVDETLNPPEIRALGQLIVEVTLYPTTPAEFVVFRIIQQPGGPSVKE